MTESQLILLVLYAVIFGAICTALAERKGMSGGEAFATGFFLGIFGLIYVLLKKDRQRWGPPPGWR